jgi:hypothetical protein
VAATTAVPAKWRLCGGDGYVGELGWVQGKVGEILIWCAAGRTRSSPRLPSIAPAGGSTVAWQGPRWDKGCGAVRFLTWRVRTCLQSEGHPPILAVRRTTSTVALAQGSTARTAGRRGVRPAGEGAGSTWRGRGPQGLGVPPPPASGRLSLGKARAAQTPRRCTARAGAPVRWSAGGVAACLIFSDCHCLSDKNSNFCN